MPIHFNAFSKSILNIIKAISGVALMMLVMISVSWNNTPKVNSPLTTIEIFFSYPISYYKENGKTKIYNLKGNIGIFYFIDYTLYRLPAKTQFETGKDIEGSEPYFIRQKNAGYGFLLNSLNDTSQGVKLSADSFLLKNIILTKNLDTLRGNLFWKSLHPVIDLKSGITIEKYIPRKFRDETTPDSIYYYFKKELKHVDYSFSKKMDSITGLKLYKLRMLYNKKYWQAKKIFLPKRELFFEIKEILVPNQNEIIDFIERFKRLKITGS